MKLALGVRGTVAGHRLGALGGGGGAPPPTFQCIPGGWAGLGWAGLGAVLASRSPMWHQVEAVAQGAL